MIADPGNRLWVSAASIWEVAIKRALDRPDFRVDPGVLQAGLLPTIMPNCPLLGAIAWGCLGCLHCMPIPSTAS